MNGGGSEREREREVAVGIEKCLVGWDRISAADRRLVIRLMASDDQSPEAIQPSERRSDISTCIGDSRRSSARSIAAGRCRATPHGRSARTDRAMEHLERSIAAAKCIARFGWSPQKIDSELGLDRAVMQSWLRDPKFISAVAELTSRLLRHQLMPLGLARLRRERSHESTDRADETGESRSRSLKSWNGVPRSMRVTTRNSQEHAHPSQPNEIAGSASQLILIPRREIAGHRRSSAEPMKTRPNST